MDTRNTIDVGGLFGPSRQQIAVDARVDVPDFEDLRFPQAAHVVLDLRGVERAIDISGTIDVQVEAACNRCLEDVKLPLHVDVDELIGRPGVEHDPFSESNVLSGESLDVGDLVRQLLTTALPMGVVCKDACQGLCPMCGRNRNDGACDHPPMEMEGDHGES